jgi:hypothetical protein
VKPIDLYVSGQNAALLHRVSELLAAHWDPRAEFLGPPTYLNASGDIVSPEQPRMPETHAEVVLALYAAGGPQADVVGYLRRAEEAALGRARTNTGQRWALAALIWRWGQGHEPIPENGRVAEPFEPRTNRDRDSAP